MSKFTVQQPWKSAKYLFHCFLGSSVLRSFGAIWHLILANSRYLHKQKTHSPHTIFVKTMLTLPSMLVTRSSRLTRSSWQPKATCSLLFSNSRWRSRRPNCVVIEDITLEVFAQMLRFMYSGEVSSGFPKDRRSELLVAADKYNLLDLVRLCLPYAVDNRTSFQEIIKLYMVASLMKNASGFKRKVVECFRGRSQKFVKS